MSENETRRRALLRLSRWGAVAGASPWLAACGGAAATDAPPSPTPAPTPATPLQRLQRSIREAVPPTVATSLVDVTQTGGNIGAPALGTTALVLPAPLGVQVNPNPVTLADLPQVWGHARSSWTRRPASYIGNDVSNASWFVPVTLLHPAATANAGGFCGLHFSYSGSAFEVLFAGTDAFATLLVDGQYASASYIASTSAGAPLNQPNAYVKFDFGSRAPRRISLHMRSSQGPCALAIAAGETVAPWDRSDAPAMHGMADSYAGAYSPHWAGVGLFHEAALALGIAHVDINGIGGTGYAPNDRFTDPGDAFGARIASMTQGQPELFVTAGGINDNNWLALPPYASAEAARLGFEAAVTAYFRDLRVALPDAVLAATGPWQPNTALYPEVALAKVDTVRAGLQAVAGPWVFIDNLRGSWANSAGVSSPSATGPWQTGTGRVGQPKGDGNGDLYVSADGTHPSEAGAAYLAQQLADSLRAAILAL